MSYKGRSKKRAYSTGYIQNAILGWFFWLFLMLLVFCGSAILLHDGLCSGYLLLNL